MKINVTKIQNKNVRSNKKRYLTYYFKHTRRNKTNQIREDEIDIYCILRRH